MRPTPACGGGLSLTCSAGSGAAEAFIVEQSHQSHQDGTIGTEGHSLLAREDDGFLRQHQGGVEAISGSGEQD